MFDYHTVMTSRAAIDEPACAHTHHGEEGRHTNELCAHHPGWG
jgi:hypothetical protein